MGILLGIHKIDKKRSRLHEIYFYLKGQQLAKLNSGQKIEIAVNSEFIVRNVV